jgi:phosphatidylinositol-3-phosphatase
MPREVFRVSRKFISAVALLAPLLTLGIPIAASSAAASGPCSGARQPAHYQHIVLIMMENKTYGNVIGNKNAPAINTLARQCAVVPVAAAAHPSLPNYIAVTSGSTQGVRDDKGPAAHPLNVASIFSQLSGDWRSYGESMPASCARRNSGLYAVRHLPALYYTNLRALCPQRVLPLPASPDLSARFTMITPNLVHDMHHTATTKTTTTQLRAGDSWLKGELPKLVNSSQYRTGTTLIILMWDEGDGAMNTVPALLVAPAIPPGSHPAGTFTDATILRFFIEGLLGLPQL